MLDQAEVAYDRPVAEDYREIPSALNALDETLSTLEGEWKALAQRLDPVCAPASDEKMVDELRIGPSSDMAQALHAFEGRVARVRNSIYDVQRRVQL